MTDLLIFMGFGGLGNVQANDAGGISSVWAGLRSKKSRRGLLEDRWPRLRNRLALLMFFATHTSGAKTKTRRRWGTQGLFGSSERARHPSRSGCERWARRR